MKGKKILFLFLALLLPVAVFIFLKTFGKNEFEVPVLHREGVPALSSRCNYQYPAPYRVADSLASALRLNRADSLYVLDFEEGLATAMQRIATEFKGDPVQLIPVRDSISGLDADFLRDCIFLVRGDTPVVLLDHKNRIRGYYAANDRDEVDRLIVEMKIILKQY